jgi:hypothetical protein
MDKKIVGLLGAAAALTAVTAASAATPSDSATAPSTYRELLNPVTNAVAALKADDAWRSEQTADRGTEVAQVFYHHHHHHHHHHWRRHHHHHHHHHHYMG